MDVGDLVLHGYIDGFLNDEEFLLLYDIKKRNLKFPYRNYPKFELGNMTNDKCIAEFRLKKDDVDVLCQTLQIPQEIRCYNGTVASGIEALCIF